MPVSDSYVAAIMQRAGLKDTAFTRVWVSAMFIAATCVTLPYVIVRDIVNYFRK